ncbi:MAG: twin-arginine translocation signal domain-containing protein, partial [Candidatus Dormibacteraceae bacterium]
MTDFEERLHATISRRTLLKAAGAGALSLSAGPLLDACGLQGNNAPTNNGKITIGYVSPQTGALAGFATGDNYVINGVRATSPYKSGFKVGSKTYDVQVIIKDTQSD